MPETIYDKMLRVRNEKGAGFIVLIDPDKLAPEHLPAFAEMCARAGVDFLFVGGSLMHATELEAYIRRIKEVSDLPVIGFPGSLTQICPSLDAVLYLSVISGRNPEYLIGQHVMGAPIIRRLSSAASSTSLSSFFAVLSTGFLRSTNSLRSLRACSPAKPNTIPRPT